MKSQVIVTAALLLIINIFIPFASANVEKTIFVASTSVESVKDASIDSLLLMSLHPDQLTTRTFLNASFPTEDQPHGQDTWALLDGLIPGQRYELRVCWLATQPTSFWIDTFPMQDVFQTPELISSLSAYSYARRDQLTDAEVTSIVNEKYKPSSSELPYNFVFLRVQAAADYFSLNKTLMSIVPPIHVDLILDPYILNVFPQSLLPTAGYIGAIAVLAFFLAGWIYRRMIGYVNDEYTKPTESEAKKND